MLFAWLGFAWLRFAALCCAVLCFAGYHADCTEQIKVRVSEIEASAHAHAHAQAQAGMTCQRERILRASGALAWAEKRVQCSQSVPC